LKEEEHSHVKPRSRKRNNTGFWGTTIASSKEEEQPLVSIIKLKEEKEEHMNTEALLSYGVKPT
jgi:hypothetical protein